MMLAFSPCRATDSLRQLKNQPFRVAHKTAQDAPERSLKRSKMASETAKMAYKTARTASNTARMALRSLRYGPI